MSVRGTPPVTTDSEPGHRAPAMAHAERRGTGRNLARRVERLFIDERGVAVLPGRTGKGHRPRAVDGSVATRRFHVLRRPPLVVP
jgi:hypothetical protein